MEKDIKHAIKNIEKKRKKIEKTEKVILFLSGIILIIIFAIIGLNIYSGIGEKISEPEVEIVSGKKLQTVKEVVIPEAEVKKQEKAENKIDTNNVNNTKVTKSHLLKDNKGKEHIEEENKVEDKREKQKSSNLKYYYSIQIGAFSSKENAKRLVKRKALKDAFIVYNMGLYRVMVGKFKTKKEAFEFLKQNNIKGLVKKIKASSRVEKF